MGKKLTDKQKEEIVKFFISGKTADELSKEFNFSKLTIIRNLKKNLGEKKYQDFLKMNKFANKNINHNEKKAIADYQENQNIISQNENLLKKDFEENLAPLTPFIEITPLNVEIENGNQKDFSSIPIDEINFPNTVYMIVDKKIELEIKLLKEYADWQFLSKEELNRETIEIFNDLKVAKRLCNKEQRVIKVPNTKVFKVVAPILLSRGISRIVSADKLIAL